MPEEKSLASSYFHALAGACVAPGGQSVVKGVCGWRSELPSSLGNPEPTTYPTHNKTLLTAVVFGRPIRKEALHIAHPLRPQVRCPLVRGGGHEEGDRQGGPQGVRPQPGGPWGCAVAKLTESVNVPRRRHFHLLTGINGMSVNMQLKH